MDTRSRVNLHEFNNPIRLENESDIVKKGSPAFHTAENVSSPDETVPVMGYRSGMIENVVDVSDSEFRLL